MLAACRSESYCGAVAESVPALQGRAGELPLMPSDDFKKGAWTIDEDELLRRLIKEHGARNW